MKHKVAELEGPWLDAAVAKLREQRFCVESYMTRIPRPIACWLLDEHKKPLFEHGPYAPSTNWVFGGPLIEWERINVIDRAAYVAENEWRGIETGDAKFAAYMGNPERIVGFTFAGYEGLEFDSLGVQTGPTPLIAAMRAYVFSKFGDEVELP